MEGLIFAKETVSAVAEAYRILCANVQAAIGKKRIVEVVGVADTGDTSAVVANLAIALAQAGKKVLIMDCNLRNPKQYELFGLAKRGLIDAVSTGEHYTTFVQETSQDNLFVIAAGDLTENLTEMLMSKEMQVLLQDAKEGYDVILLDVPPVTVFSDAIALGTKTDGVLLVLTNKQDKVELVQKAKEMFAQAGITILGCILNKA